MDIFSHLLAFLAASACMWVSAGFIINGVESFSKNMKANSFIISFIILGILTSVTEISVGINSILLSKPEIFAGNLIGSSFVIILFIIPLLAVLGKGIQFKETFSLDKLLFFLILLVSPAMVALDGKVSVFDAVLLLLLYGFFFHLFNGHKVKNIEDFEPRKINKKDLIINFSKILIGAAIIFFASQVLVDKTLYFATFFNAPPFIVSLFILSIGTNLPELAIAIGSSYRKKNEIALGDYIGSAAANVMLFGIFTFFNGPFNLETNHFYLMLPVVGIGFVLFFIFCRSKNTLSVFEGVLLLLIYFIYLFLQMSDIAML